MELYFKDNFFSAGTSAIMNAAGESLGTIDLKSGFGSSLDIYDQTGVKVCGGKFPFLSGKWHISLGEDVILGVVRMRLSFFSKKFEYDARDRGLYEITAPAFTNEYSVQDSSGQTVATFNRTSSWLQSGAFCLHNHCTQLDSYELVAVVMGIHAIQKQQSNAAT